MQKNTVLTLSLLSLAVFGLGTAQANVKLILDESSPLGMVGDTQYDLDNNVIEITLDRPVLCNKTSGYQAGSLTRLKIYDPNLEMKGGFGANEGLYFAADADYSVNNGQLFLDTDNPAKALCVSAEVGDYDLIFKAPFENMPPAAAQIKYVGLPNIVAPGQILNYEIQFHNPSGQTIYFDLLEYWNEHFDHAATLTASDNVRTCNNSDPDVQCVVNDPDSGVIKGIQLADGGTFILDVTQKVSPSAQIGAELDFMVAAFLTDGPNGDFLPRSYSDYPKPNDPHIVSKTVTVANNTLPELSWDVAPGSLTTFHEDEALPKVFEISYSDIETVSQDLDVTVIDQLGNILDITQGPFVLNGLDGTKTITLLPLANAYTEPGSPEQITVTVTDAAAGQASLSFDVEVLPVNDAPTFAMNCSELVVDEQGEDMTCTSPITQSGQNGTQGVWDDEFIIADFNPGPNESHQSVLDYEINVVDDGGILDMGGNGDPVWISPTTGEISVVTLTGQYGTAEVEIRVRDDGGTTDGDGCGALPTNPEHGCDVSGWQTLIIVSQPYQYSVSGEITGVPSGKLFTLRLDGTDNNQPILVDTAITTNTDVNTPHPFTLLDLNLQTQLLDNGTPYTVTLEAAPPSHTCVLNNGTGSISGANITNVQVSCTENGN